MVFPGIISLACGEPDYLHFFISAVITLLFGGAMTLFNRNYSKDVSKQDSYIIVTSVWITFVIFGMLPFWFSGSLPFLDAAFETMSGFTTTGSSMLADIESSTHGILYWRSLLQWLGGMGIIALSLVLVPTLGMSSMQTFTAEASVTRADKIHPKVNEMARYMWYIYITATVVEIVLLMFGGMSFFEAMCHAMSTVSTGGFSTRNGSIGDFNSPYIEYVTIIFMFLGGVNFALYYCLLVGKGKRVLTDDELKSYTFTVIGCTVIISLILCFLSDQFDTESSIRHGLFLVISVMTGSGFTTCDYMTWPIQTTIIIALMMPLAKV